MFCDLILMPPIFLFVIQFCLMRNTVTRGQQILLAPLANQTIAICNVCKHLLLLQQIRSILIQICVANDLLSSHTFFASEANE